MYTLRPVVDTSDNIRVPEGIYGMNPIVCSVPKIPIKSKGESDSHTDQGELTQIEARQKQLIEKLVKLQDEVAKLEGQFGVKYQPKSGNQVSKGVHKTIKDVVISANPENPPAALLVLKELLEQQCKVCTTCHTHSSATHMHNPLKNLFQSKVDRQECELVFTLVWKNVTSPSVMVSPTTQFRIEGEMNVARYLARLLSSAYDAPGTDITASTEIDQWVDMGAELQTTSSREKTGLLKSFNSQLGKKEWLVGTEMSLADIALWGALTHGPTLDKAPANVKKWFQQCNNLELFRNVMDLLQL